MHQRKNFRARSLPVLFITGSFVLLILGCPRQHAEVLTEQYRFNSNGQLTLQISSGGNRTEYGYDRRGFPASIESPGESVKFRYDGDGNRIEMHDNSGSMEYFYDGLDRLSGYINRKLPEKIVLYDYDPWDDLIYLGIYDLAKVAHETQYAPNIPATQPPASANDKGDDLERERKFMSLRRQLLANRDMGEGTASEFYAQYFYDVQGNLIQIRTRSGTISFSYDPDHGQVTRQFPNGITSLFTYDVNGLLTSLCHRNSRDEVIAEYDYSYDPAGKVTAVVESSDHDAKTTRFTWKLGYLKELDLPSGKPLRYGYNFMGDRVSVREGSNEPLVYTYDRFGNLMQAGQTQFEWNEEGLQTKQIEGRNVTELRYDHRGLPTLVRTTEGSLHLGWDGDGNLISKKTAKEATCYLTNPQAPPGCALAEYDVRGNLKTAWLYGNGLLGWVDADGRLNCFLEDGFNSLRMSIDPSGAATSHWDYSPFGELQNQSGVIKPTFLKSGERYLPEIDELLIGHRLYDPRLARFLTPAPALGSPARFDSYNRYTRTSSDFDSFMEPWCNHSASHDRVIQEVMEQVRQNSPGWWLPAWMQRGGLVSKDFIPLQIQPDKQTRPLDMPDDPSHPHVRELFSGTRPWLKPGVLSIPLTHSARLLWQNVQLQWDSTATELTSIKVKDKTIWNKSLETSRPGVDLSNARNAKNFLISAILPLAGRPNVILNGLAGGCLKDPFLTLKNHPTGIVLASSENYDGNIGHIIGAVYDSSKHCIVLVGDGNPAAPPVDSQDLAVCLACVFDIRGQDPAFSLDPADHRNPEGEWLKCVYIPEEIIRGTSFGQAFLDADWLLKQYSMGICLAESGKAGDPSAMASKYSSDIQLVKSNLRAFERISRVAGYKSIPHIMLDANSPAPKQWYRFWIELKPLPNDTDYNILLKMTPDEKSFYFDIADMAVNARRTVPDPSSPTGLRDVIVDDPQANRFSNMFTGLYDELALESPAFERVRQLVKVIALAKWMKRQAIPVDEDWINDNLKGPGRYTDKKHSLSVEWQRVTASYRQTVYVFGGVDGSVRPKFEPEGKDQHFAELLRREVAVKLAASEANPVFSFECDGQTYQAEVLPINSNGRQYWLGPKKQPSTTLLPANKGTIRSVNNDGNTIEYHVGSEGQFQSVKFTQPNGWTTTGEKTAEGSVWKTNNSLNVYENDFNSSGDLRTIKVNGEDYANIVYSPEIGSLEVNYSGFGEQSSLDSKQRLVRYRRYYTGTEPAATPESGALEWQYDDHSRPISFRQEGTAGVSMQYTGYNFAPSIVTTARANVHCEYDAQNRLTRMTYSGGGGTTAWFNYQPGGQIGEIGIESQSRKADFMFDEQGLKVGFDMSDLHSEISHPDQASSAIESNLGNGSFNFDAQTGRSKLIFPDGSTEEIIPLWEENKSPVWLGIPREILFKRSFELSRSTKLDKNWETIKWLKPVQKRYRPGS